MGRIKTSNRGDKMIDRSVKKYYKAEDKLEKKIVKKYEKPLAKQQKLKEKMGSSPNERQLKRIAKSAPNARDKANYDLLKSNKSGMGVLNPWIKDDKNGPKPIKRLQTKMTKSMGKAFKGQAISRLSDNVKYIRSQKGI